MNKQVYPNWRLDKNISWYNIENYIMGIIWGIITIEWLRPKSKFIIRLKPPKFWLPIVYAKQFKGVKRKK